MKTKRTKKTYPEDPIAEVRQIRDELAAEHHYDVQEICAAAMKRQKASGRRCVDRSATRPAAATNG